MFGERVPRFCFMRLTLVCTGQLGTIHIRSQCLLARCQACRLAPHDMVGCTKYSKAGSPWASMHFQPFCTHSGLVTQPLRERYIYISIWAWIKHNQKLCRIGGMNIHKQQLFFCENQGTDEFTASRLVTELEAGTFYRTPFTGY